MNCLGSGLGQLAGTGGVGMHAVGQQLGMTGEEGVHIDYFAAERGAELVDARPQLAEVHLGDISGVDESGLIRTWQDSTEKDPRLGLQFLEGLDERSVIVLKVFLKLPVHWLGIVGAEHDHHHVGLHRERILVALLLHVRQVALAQQSASADAKILYLVTGAQQRLELRRVALVRLETRTLGDAIADAGNLDGLSSSSGNKRRKDEKQHSHRILFNQLPRYAFQVLKYYPHRSLPSQ